jgi:hypothetical protein
MVSVLTECKSEYVFLKNVGPMNLVHSLQARFQFAIWRFIHCVRVFTTPISLILAVYVCSNSNDSSKRNTISPILFSSSSKPVSQYFSTILFILFVCGTVDTQFFANFR